MDISATTEVTTNILQPDKASIRTETLPISDTSSEKTDSITLTATTISVSCIRLKWNGDGDAEYTVTVFQSVCDDYIDNIYFEFKSNTICYVTGLRENSEYTFEVADENNNVLATAVQRTEAVEVIQEFDYIDGWTNCFAMGTFFGYCGDRFLITLENGTQFTIKICDSKGDRVYHPFGGDGKCIVEFIYADGYFPDCVAISGNYGSYNWYGLNFDNIQSIKKINYGNPIEY